jgi:hypothetical protein
LLPGKRPKDNPNDPLYGVRKIELRGDAMPGQRQTQRTEMIARNAYWIRNARLVLRWTITKRRTIVKKSMKGKKSADRNDSFPERKNWATDSVRER